MPARFRSEATEQAIRVPEHDSAHFAAFRSIGLCLCPLYVH
ncbi:uncharacterized protein CLAFUR5_20393 [Fulvia fulva]|nr:uncharacterized protein CLAFUR5_20393 [Fulvia fulva]KAK4608901.1 hypothetical protein CLAFUR0_14861 [Fulvia fulva]WMI39110.1 hypothetical protein CLAFUR5_20393 [Fulvia fulva]